MLGHFLDGGHFQAVCGHSREVSDVEEEGLLQRGESLSRVHAEKLPENVRILQRGALCGSAERVPEVRESRVLRIFALVLSLHEKELPEIVRLLRGRQSKEKETEKEEQKEERLDDEAARV